MNTILKINQLTKKFGLLTAVNNISFTIEKGNIYGILGPNGSGKSTTLGMVLNVVNKTSGDFQWFNGEQSIHQALKKVGAIIEHPNFYPYMTAKQNLNLVCKIKNVTNAKIEEKLELVGLLDRKDSNFSSFSLGMKQRLAIASALLNDPEILILDEPTNGLDPQGIHQIREIIRKIAATGTTILLASHLLDEVEKVCSHVIIIRKGVMLYSGKVDEMNASHGYVEMQAQKNALLIEVLKNHEWFENITIDKETGLTKAILTQPIEAEKLNQMLFEKGIILSHLVKRKESLEQQFLELTQQNA
ncbi:ABC transporter ATP-binding protein [Mesonia aestuariivivens]|uniref:ATP-binding cassette domain-containing protein n=1 Tax=Mesonia aestuariivivens TaxID=2796128 RepID=A0ABS6W1H9_9FLAO|nr:ATP-binding cassette domain-containing protein [Mesonia aestuariivivens]MBW2961376.1 ATP-binding cassette domain-containing protein [Mesonia aestuariivivens]